MKDKGSRINWNLSGHYKKHLAWAIEAYEHLTFHEKELALKEWNIRYKHKHGIK